MASTIFFIVYLHSTVHESVRAPSKSLAECSSDSGGEEDAIARCTGTPIQEYTLNFKCYWYSA